MNESEVIKKYQRELASLGGVAVRKKYGKRYFKELRRKRELKRAK